MKHMKWSLFLASVFSSLFCVGQVNLQTGAAQVGFPIFNYTDSKSGIGTSISLGYTAGNGLLVNDLATCVGTGWSLQMSGSITRIQHGEPDDQVGVSTANNSVQIDRLALGIFSKYYYPNGYLYTAVSPLTPYPNHVSFIPVYPHGFVGFQKPNFEDREQDEFAFQFNGRSGKFRIGKNWEPQVMIDSKLQIAIETADMTADKIRTRITAFTITDESGIKYKFAAKEVTDVLNYSTTYNINGDRVVKGTEQDNFLNRKIITQWFLSEIFNPATNEKIVFNYNSIPIDIDGVKHMSRQRIDADGDVRYTYETLQERTKMVTQRLASILFPDNHKVNFTYTTLDRVDLPGDKALAEIAVLYNNNVLYTYQFNYGYFFKGQITAYNFAFAAQDKRWARLCLNNFRKVGADGAALPANEFTYNVPDGNSIWVSIPAMYTLYEDHWGYFSNNLFHTTEHANGYGSLTGAKGNVAATSMEPSFGIIKKIKYPEGGTLEFAYEINKSEASGYTNKYAGGVRVAKIFSYDGVDHANDIVKHYAYVKADGITSSAWGYEAPRYTETKALRQYKVDNAFSTGTGVKEFACNFISSLFSSAPANIAAQSISGGMFGSVSIQQAALDAFIIYAVFLIIDIFFSSDYEDYEVGIIKSDNYSLINPLPAQYNRVEVIDAIYSNGAFSGNTNGKVVYEFTDPVLYALIDPGPLAAPYSAKQRSLEWVYGLPKVTTTCNAAGLTVKKVEHFYTTIARQLNATNFTSRAYSVNRSVGADGSDPFMYISSIFQSSFINTETYVPWQGRIELNRTVETIYNSLGAYSTSETFYEYSPSNFLPRTVYTKDSKGDLMGTTTFYVSDYNVAGVINQMKTANIVNLPVSKNTWFKGAQDASRQLTLSSVLEYAQLPDNQFRLFQTYQSETASPVGNSIVEAGDVSFDNTNFKNYPYLKLRSSVLYTDGNPVQQTITQGNSSASAIYDYNKRIIVAEVTNATMDEIKYTSFEADGNGGWSFSLPGIVADYSPTGKKSYDLSKGNVTLASPLSSNKTYIVSLWTTQGQLSINTAGGTVQPVKTGPAINGWTYMEFELTGLSNINSLSIGGTGKVDELRLYPKTARMVSYTYDPAIGKTSECDANNRITYNEYDSFGRLKGTRDQYRNLIKAYEYNYKQ